LWGRLPTLANRRSDSLPPLGRVRSNEFLLIFSIGDYELTIFPDGRAIVKGTHDPAMARSIYAKYIGA
jgi:adenylyltransferase/sulfurtransferase